MSTPAIVYFVASIAALFAVWRKERVVDGTLQANRSAIRAAFALQIVAAFAGGYALYFADREAREARLAQVAFEANAATSSHLKNAMDIYLKCLVPGHSTLSNLSAAEKAIASTPLGVQQSLYDAPATRHALAQKEQLMSCFSKLQDEASSVLADAMKYGDSLPSEAAQWAQTTVKLRPDELVALTGPTERAQEYLFVMAQAFSSTLAIASRQNQDRSK